MGRYIHDSKTRKEIVDAHYAGYTYEELGKHYGISRSTVCNYVAKKRKIIKPSAPLPPKKKLPKKITGGTEQKTNKKQDFLEGIMEDIKRTDQHLIDNDCGDFLRNI